PRLLDGGNFALVGVGPRDAAESRAQERRRLDEQLLPPRRGTFTLVVQVGCPAPQVLLVADLDQLLLELEAPCEQHLERQRDIARKRDQVAQRSEERRVGKECGSRRAGEQS